MDLQVIHNHIRYILQKERGGWVAPEEIDDVLHRAQWEKYIDYFKIYATDQEAKDNLTVFSTKLQFTTSNGVVTLPTDTTVNPCYEHLLSMYVQYFDNKHQVIRYKPVKFYSESEIPEMMDVQILAPTVTDPLGEQTSRGVFQLYPKVSLSGYTYYLRQPVRPLFSYTMVGRVITYNSGSSVQMEWNETCLDKIIMKAIQLVGVNLGDGEIVQFTETKQ